MQKLIASFILTILIGATASCIADVAPTTLEKLIKVSKLAVVAKVTRIINVEGSKIAEADILLTLKGDSRIKRLYFPAQPIWTCDTSNAILNETALLFLEPEPLGADESSPFSKKLREAIGDNPLLLISWSGRGRIPVTRVGQMDYLPVLANSKMADVRFPKEIATIPTTGPPDASVRLARLEDVVAFIRRKVGS